MGLTRFNYPDVYHYYDEERRDRAGGYYTMYYTTGGVPRAQLCFNYVKHYNNYDYTNHYNEANAIDIQLWSFANGIKFIWKSYCDTSASSGSNVFITGPVNVYDKNGNDITNAFYNAWRGNTSREWVQATPYKNEGVAINNVSFAISHFEIQYTDAAGADAIYGVRTDFESRREPHHTPVPLSGIIESSDYQKFWNSYQAFSMTTDQSFNKFYDAVVHYGDDTPITPIKPSEDTSHTGGGDDDNPNYFPFSDDIPFPDMPSVSALGIGMINAYSPTRLEIAELGTKLWSDNFIEEIRKINNDPMEAVISLHLLPFNVPTGAAQNCMVGNYNSEIPMNVITQQFLMIGGGDTIVSERFASALDYSPYTTAHIHIPFVGIVPLDIDYIMGKSLRLRYQLDVLSGGAVAMLMCGNAVMYTFPCNLATTIPLTSSNHQALYREIIQLSSNVANTIVAGSTGSDKGRDARVGHGIVSSLESAMNTVCSKHSEVQKSGAITGVQGALDSFDTYLIFHRPVQSLAQNFAHFKGFPCNITYTLSSLSGYTEVEYAHLEGVTATDAEKDEIQKLLQAGVIL